MRGTLSENVNRHVEERFEHAIHDKLDQDLGKRDDKKDTSNKNENDANQSMQGQPFEHCLDHCP